MSRRNRIPRDDRLEGLLRQAVDGVREDAAPADAQARAVARAAVISTAKPAMAVASPAAGRLERRQVWWLIAASLALLASLAGLDAANRQPLPLATVGNSTHNSQLAASSLPSPSYMNDDVQYFPPGPDFKRTRNATVATGPAQPFGEVVHDTPDQDKFVAAITTTVNPQSWDEFGRQVPNDGFRADAQDSIWLGSETFFRQARANSSRGGLAGMSAPGAFSADIVVTDGTSNTTFSRESAEGVHWRFVAPKEGPGQNVLLDDSESMTLATLHRPQGLEKAADGEEILDERILRRRQQEQFHTENYARIHDNRFLAVRDNPLSTFSVDVDTASYSNVRRFLTGGQLPPPDAVRIEELVNYFPYDYAPPADDKPFAVHTEIAGCPWLPEHRLVRVGLKGRVIAEEQRLASNLVFLLDVSGSMDDPKKLPLLKSSLRLLIDRLQENDRVAIVVYAGASGLVLPGTPGDRKADLHAALDRLAAGGSTNGAQGIELAYATAEQNLIKGGINRVILCTDGDFNVGVTSEGDLTRLIEEKAKSGVFLSVLGYGMDNLQDATLEALADKGNGNYAYIDTEQEARKLLVEQIHGTLITIAKDVKIQIEFNPAEVAAYRLLGYENRMLKAEDFTDDKKDAGEIGAGHTVTALYEVVPVPKPAADRAAPAKPATADTGTVEPLKYLRPAELTAAAAEGDLLTLKLRYKLPDGDTSTPLEFPVKDAGAAYGAASGEFKFAAAVAGFGMLLRRSPFAGNLSFDAVKELATEGKGADPHGYRAEFLDLVARANALQPPPPAAAAPAETPAEEPAAKQP